MPTYSGIQKEETLKSLVHQDFFSNFGYEPNIDNIDFVITDKKTHTDLFSDGPGNSHHYLWAEAKKGTHDVFEMFTQLILTCKKTYEKGEHLAPPWLGCFDEARIAFVSFHDMLPIFTETDFNWNQTPSSHETEDFQKAREKVTKLIGAKIAVYNFGSETREIKEFIKTHFSAGASSSIKSPITKDNFVQIFIKWVKEVKPVINLSKERWARFIKNGILDGDFYRADIMSSNGNSITEKLKIILENDKYKLRENIEGDWFENKIDFTDGGAAYSRFWNRYERPPALEFRQHIIDRRDLLVPANIREVKGSFFTPKIWADKSKEYLAKVFGEDWQDEYYVWDCAAGTGNLLAGLTNEYNVWASDVEQGNVETMQSLVDIDENLNLLSGHVFQFDFLNDSFDKLPAELKKIIDDPEKRKKLIVYINPPYAESSGGEKAKIGVSTAHKTHSKYISVLGKAANELFSQFIARAYNEISGSTLALFSTLKYLNSSNFQKFRSFVKADYKGGFMCLANTFDNVHGNFPIGFLIWQFGKDSFPKEIRVAVLNIDGTDKGLKSFYNGFTFINDWISKGEIKGESIGTLYYTSNDFQQNNLVYISLAGLTSHLSRFAVTKDTLIKGAVYFTVRHVFEHTWINDRDQFYYPNDGYKTNAEFQNNCLVFALFHGQNKISAQYGVNHWLSFTEKEVGAREKFESNFMSGFLKGRTLSAEAAAVLDAGRELWKYYHAKTRNDKTASVNASFYDIREFFQGRDENGRMNNKSNDETYNNLLASLRETFKPLTKKIIPKIYQYGFLKE